MSFVVRCMLSAACRMLSGCCLWHDACRRLHFPRCMLHVVSCLLHIFRWSSAALLPVGSCLRALSLLHVARSPSPVAYLPAPVSPVAWRALSVACPTSLLVTLQWLHVAALRVVCCLLHAARPMLHGVRCLSPFPRSHLVTVHVAALCVVCRMLHVARSPSHMLSLVRCLSHLACRLSHAVCCPLQSDTAPSHTQRIVAALALERLSGRRALLQTEVCARARLRSCG
jgi:hypothetical protein